MKRIAFRKIVRFTYYGITYDLFKDRKEHLAFLKVLEDGSYDYPSYNEFAGLVRFYNDSFTHGGLELFEREYNFLPCLKEKVNGKIRYVMITSALVLSTLTGCANAQGTEALAHDHAYEQEDQSIIFVDETKEVDQTLEDEIQEVVDKSSMSEDIVVENNIPETDEVKEDTLTRLYNEITDDNTMKDYHYDLYDDDNTPLDRDFMYSKNQNVIILLNSDLINDCFETRDYTKEEVLELIDNKDNLPEDFKAFTKDFVNTMDSYYDGLDYRMFAKNIEKLEVVTKDVEQIKQECGGKAYFDNQKGVMVLPDTIDYNQEYYRVIIRHELGHMFNCITVKPDSIDCEISYSPMYYGHGINVYEAVNTLFTAKPFLDDYTEERKQNLGYALIANELDIIFEGSNYNLKNSVNDNVYDLEKYLNDNSSIEDANKLMDQIEQQWYDYKNEGYHVAPHEIDYLTDVTVDMFMQNKEVSSYEDIQEAKQEYLTFITKGVKYTDKINYEAVDNAFNQIMEKNQISSYTK